MLDTIPGLGERTIAQLLACIGRPERFKSVKAQGKPSTVIVVACMHQLLAIAYGVLRSGKAFNPDPLERSAA